MSMGTVVKCGHLSHARMPLQDVYLDEKGKLVENFRVAAFGHIDGDQTPLHYAAKAGSASCVKLLLQGHADANFKDSHLRTAVHIAAMLGAVEALDVLLSTKCIDPVFNRKYDADFSLKDIQGKTALKLATVWECKRLIWKRYLERWAQRSVAMKAVGGERLFCLLLLFQFCINMRCGRKGMALAGWLGSAQGGCLCSFVLYL